MRRRTPSWLLALVWAFVGCIFNIFFVSALATVRNRDPMVRNYGYYSLPGSSLLWMRASSFGFEENWIVPGGLTSDVPDVAKGPQPGWRSRQLEPGPPFVWITTAIGWPLKTFYCEWTNSRSVLEVELATDGVTPRGGFLYGQALLGHSRTSAINDREVIPLKPIWFGCTFNSLLFGALGLLAHLSLRLARKWNQERLVRTDRCPECGYNLSGLKAVIRCPECGWKTSETGM